MLIRCTSTENWELRVCTFTATCYSSSSSSSTVQVLYYFQLYNMCSRNRLMLASLQCSYQSEKPAVMVHFDLSLYSDLTNWFQQPAMAENRCIWIYSIYTYRMYFIFKAPTKPIQRTVPYSTNVVVCISTLEVSTSNDCLRVLSSLIFCSRQRIVGYHHNNRLTCMILLPFNITNHTMAWIVGPLHRSRFIRWTQTSYHLNTMR